MEESKQVPNLGEIYDKPFNSTEGEPTTRIKKLMSKEHKLGIYISSSYNFWEQVDQWTKETLEEICKVLNDCTKNKENKDKHSDTISVRSCITAKMSESDIMENFKVKLDKLLFDIEECNLHASFEDALIVTSEDELVYKVAPSQNNTTLKWINSIEHEELLKRRKGKHLSARQKAHIIRTLAEFPEDRKMIKSLYKLSPNILHKLSKVAETRVEYDSIWFPTNDDGSRVCWEYKNYVRRLLKPPTVPISIRMIRSQIYEKLGDMLSYHQVRRTIKEDLGYSYKRRWSRPPKYMDSKLMKQKGVFWIELMMIMNKLQTIYNVDEWSFERSLKQEYSWLSKSGGGAIINNVSEGKASLILVTGSDSSWFAMVKSETVNSYIFWVFMMLFWKVLNTNQGSSLETKVIILDNARTHNSILTKDVISKLGI